MATILKLNLEVNNTNLADSYNISLSTADCLRNLENDLARDYLPSLGESNENMRGLMTSVRKTIGSEDQVVIFSLCSTLTKTKPPLTLQGMSSTIGRG